VRSQVKVLLRQIARLEDEAEIAKRLADFGTAERNQLYRFIALQADDFPISVLCRLCGVSRSSYYSWLSTMAGPKESELEEAYLANQIYDIWKKSRGRYGAPRITAELWRAAVQVNGKKVARIMAEIAIEGRSGRRKVKTTTRDHSQPLEKDLVKRDFAASRPDELYVTDITYIPTDEGFLYLAAILDVHTRAVLGWSMATQLAPRLCLDALDAVASYRRRRHFPGTVLHLRPRMSIYGYIIQETLQRYGHNLSPWEPSAIHTITL